MGVACEGSAVSLLVMPISWGTYTSEPSTVSGYDIYQYCQFFSMSVSDIYFHWNDGLWTVTVSKNGKVIAESLANRTLFSSLNDCYMIMRGFNSLS